MVRVIITLFLVISAIVSFGQVSTSVKFKQEPLYKDPKQPIEKRVADLLKRMTLEEKVSQLQSMHASRPRLHDTLFANAKRMDSLYGNGVSMMNPAFDETMEQTIDRRNKLQRWLKQSSRLGIPAIFIDEAHHGLVQKNVDVFPHGIGMACAWDTALMTKIYDFVARQASSRGTSLVLSPVVDVVRDPRWGRTGECWGEDPFLNGVFGTAVVKGFQGTSNGIPLKDHVAATLKHFTGHGEPQAGNNTGPVNYSERALREFHMEPFRMIVRDAKPAGIMASYNEVAEIPSHANRWLLTDVLRKEWGFKGMVVSDWFGIDQLKQKHQLVPDLKEAALRAFNAGVNIDLPYGINYKFLIELAKEGKISKIALDNAVADVLRLKFQMGLFEREDIDVSIALDFNKRTEGRAMALKIAEECIVLLKNKEILPISKNKVIAVVGPCGNANYLGDYSGVPAKNVSIYQALKARGVDVSYSKGVHLTTNGDTISQNNYQFIDSIKFASKEANQKLIAEAVEAAKKADFIIVAVGENEQFSREAWNNHPGDMTDLNLQSQQEDLVKAIHELGKPYVVYLMHGRPLSINWIAQNSPAIIDGWFSGEESGNAFANIIFGDVNPSGKLTISIPKSVGQIPIYYNRKPTSQFYPYVMEKAEPLYNFGYGISYTSYWYDPIKLNGRTVSVDVSNTGKMKGDEIVQLYIGRKNASVVRPVKELKGFLRVTLNAGETKNVSFSITDEMLKFWTADMKFATEPGDYEIMIGPNSKELQSIKLTLK